MGVMRGGSGWETLSDDKLGCARGMAGREGGSSGGRFLGCAMFNGVNTGLTAVVADGVGSSVR